MLRILNSALHSSEEELKKEIERNNEELNEITQREKYFHEKEVELQERIPNFKWEMLKEYTAKN